MSLKTTVGSSSATSFATVTEASSFLTAAPIDTAAWTPLTTAQKEVRLIYAARLMSYLSWIGYRVYINQALCFPRTCQPDLTIVPSVVKEAQSLIAWVSIHKGLVSVSSPTAGRAGPPVTRVSLGGLLDVAFGAVRSERSVLTEIVALDEFPVFLALAEYLTPIRIRNGTRPELLPEVA